MFIDDEEKMFDFVRETKGSFLGTYSYLTEKEYDDTMEEYKFIKLIKRISNLTMGDIEEINACY